MTKAAAICGGAGAVGRFFLGALFFFVYFSPSQPRSLCSVGHGLIFALHRWFRSGFFSFSCVCAGLEPCPAHKPVALSFAGLRSSSVTVSSAYPPKHHPWRNTRTPHWAPVPRAAAAIASRARARATWSLHPVRNWLSTRINRSHHDQRPLRLQCYR